MLGIHDLQNQGRVMCKVWHIEEAMGAQRRGENA